MMVMMIMLINKLFSFYFKSITLFKNVPVIYSSNLV